MNNLIEKTEAYVHAFNNKDIKTIRSYMSKDFTLTDPSVRDLSPASAVCDFITDIFEQSGNEFSFHACNIWQSGMLTFIEFRLNIGLENLEGVDIITWNDQGLMIEMRAYLNIRA